MFLGRRTNLSPFGLAVGLRRPRVAARQDALRILSGVDLFRVPDTAAFADMS